MIFYSLKDFYDENGTLRTLDHNDEICFNDKTIYKVWSFTFAIPRSPENPDKIFIILGLDKWKTCFIYYGYSMEFKKLDYGFPEFRSHDYEAATRVMLYLMKEWERQQKLIVVPHEIMELFNFRKIFKRWRR